MTLTACASCGKRYYVSRKVARKAARRNHPGQHMSAYLGCDGSGWHLGHLPGVVTSGTYDRSRAFRMRNS